MSPDERARVALGVVLGGLAAVAITKAGLTPQSATLRWIAYCVVAGILINTQTGIKLRELGLASILSALGLVGAVLWMILLGAGAIPALSGVSLDISERPGFATSILVGLFGVSAIGVLIGGLARPATLDVLQRMTQIDLAKAKKIESFIKVLVSICGTVALFLL